jgi:drug/metabolite transporter (DMT)-like permease
MTEELRAREGFGTDPPPSQRPKAVAHGRRPDADGRGSDAKGRRSDAKGRRQYEESGWEGGLEARGRGAWQAIRADVLAVSAVVNWGLSYGLTKLAFAEWRPLPFTGTRFLAMAGIATAVLARQGRLGVVVGPDRGRFALAGLCGFTLYQLGFALGLERTSAFSSALLLTTIPLFSLLFLRLARLEPVRRGQWVGVGLAACGIAVFVVARPGGPHLEDARWGDLLSLGAAASFALFGVVTRPLTSRHAPSTVLAGSLLPGSLPLLAFALGASPSGLWRSISLGGWAIWAYSVVVPVYLGYTWWTGAIAARGVGAIAPYVLLVPVVGGLFALVGLGERFTPAKMLGAALTLLGPAVSRGWLARPRAAPGAGGRIGDAKEGS